MLASSVRAPPQTPCPRRPARRTVERMGDTGGVLECVGRGDGSGCPYGAVLTIDAGIPEYRCDDCRHYWELDFTQPGRRPVVDDGLTRPVGDPDEAAHRGGTAA